MGSQPGCVGNNNSILGFTFTAAGQDSGVMGVLPAPNNYEPAIRMWPVGWTKFAFQLCGSGTGFAITVYGTFDLDTVLGLADNWFILPGSPTDATQGQWSNPMLSGNPQASALTCMAPLLAVRATSADSLIAPAAGSIDFRFMVVS